MEAKKIFSITALAVFLIASITTAFAYYNYYNFVPSEFLENEWIVFGGVFALVFAVVYVALSGTFSREKRREYKGRWEDIVELNKGPVIVISLVVALFVASAVSQRVFLYGYFGDEIGTWILTIMALILIAVFILIAKRFLGAYGILTAFAILWLIFHNTDPYDTLPYNLADSFGSLYELFFSFLGLIILIITGIIIYYIKKK